MKYSEIYKILSFEKTKLIITKLLYSYKNNLIIVSTMWAQILIYENLFKNY
jgi:hypothetical protein